MYIVYCFFRTFSTRSVLCLIRYTSCPTTRCTFYCVLKLARLTVIPFNKRARYQNKFAVRSLALERALSPFVLIDLFSSAGLAQRWQANNVTTLAATKVDYGLLVVGKQRNSTMSLNVTRYR